MSNERNPLKRWIGKVKNQITQNGSFQKIWLDAISPTEKDGMTPNKFYKGNLVWFDQETGKRYLVKQLSIHVPQGGMKPDQIQKGYIANITLTLDNEYEVDELPS